MPVKLVFLGKLADLAGVPEREVEGPLNWNCLLAALSGPLRRAVEEPRIRLALNGTVLSDKTGLAASPGDEIALLPPVSGG